VSKHSLHDRLDIIVDALDSVASGTHEQAVRTRRAAARLAFLGDSYLQVITDQSEYGLQQDDGARWRPPTSEQDEVIPLAA
jgi:hypothetical protein